MKKINSVVLSTLTAAFLVGCGGGGGSSPSGDSETPTTETSTVTTSDVTVERGPVYGSTVTDNNGQVATQKEGTNVYTFATTPVYPISANGGNIDVNGNGIIDEGDIELTTTLTSYSAVITPITTYLGNTSSDEGKTKVRKLKEILNDSTLSDDDLIKKVPSELSVDVLVLTNTLYDIMNDGDTSNDDFISDYENSKFKTLFTELKTLISGYEDKKVIAKMLEEKVIKNLGLPTPSTLLKVADLTKFVSYKIGEDWFDINTVSGNVIAYTSYSDGPLGFELDSNPNETSIVTLDSSNPYKLFWVESGTNEEGTLTIEKTEKVTSFEGNTYTDLYKTEATIEITKQATSSSWDRWDWENPTYAMGTSINDINSLIAAFTRVDADTTLSIWSDVYDEIMFNANGDVVKADSSDVHPTRSTTKVGTWTKSDDQMVIVLDSNENRFIRVVNDNETYYIETGEAHGVGYKQTEIMFTGSDLDALIANIKKTSQVNSSSSSSSSTGISIFQSGETFNGLVYNIVTSPITGKQWLDRNLGASQNCTAFDDASCYGDYYQWGRLSDGHEKVDSAITSTLVTSITNVGNQFIFGSSDWTTADSDGTLRASQWSKSDGTGICPVGFKVPTQIELANETTGYTGTINTNSGAVKVIGKETAFENFLKIPSSGFHSNDDGSVSDQGLWGGVWTSSLSNSYENNNHITQTENLIPQSLDFATGSIVWGDDLYSDGLPIRCVEAN